MIFISFSIMDIAVIDLTVYNFVIQVHNRNVDVHFASSTRFLLSGKGNSFKKISIMSFLSAGGSKTSSDSLPFM